MSETFRQVRMLARSIEGHCVVTDNGEAAVDREGVMGMAFMAAFIGHERATDICLRIRNRVGRRTTESEGDDGE